MMSSGLKKYLYLIKFGIRISDSQCLKGTERVDTICVFCATSFGSKDGRAHRITLFIRKHSVGILRSR